ncbi:MAG: 3D domain-containing protein [Parcubacteria group bacterium]|jgi:3D (Asp-Asp-Asp) domain-containing protein
MRILASTILLSLVLNFAIIARAKAEEVSNQNTEQKPKYQSDERIANGEKGDTQLKIVKIASVNNSFIAPTYISEGSSKNYSRLKKISPTATRNIPSGSFVMNASAYTASADECGKSDGITASGARVQSGRTLACPSVYRFGTKVEIEGMGTYICEDRGGAIKGNHFDIYMKTKKEAFSFGRRNLVASVIE